MKQYRWAEELREVADGLDDLTKNLSTSRCGRSSKAKMKRC